MIAGIMGGFTATQQQTYKEGSLLPVMVAEELLAAGRHQAVLRQLEEVSGLPKAHYVALYGATVESFVEFVQVVPDTFTGPLCSMMNAGIARGIIALQVYQAEHSKYTDPLMSYASFTAGLFRDISRILLNQSVVITDKQGNSLQTWRPLGASLVGQGEYYRLLPRAPIYQRLDSTLRHLLVRQLMPEVGYQWIARDFSVLADWFDAVEGGEGGGGLLMHILSLIKQDDVQALEDSLVQVPVRQQSSPATEHGAAFYRWLIEGVQKGQIKVNTSNAAVHRVNEGVFLERPGLFKEFAEVYDQPVTMNVVFAQFGNLMGIAKKGGYDLMNAQYFSEYAEARETSVAAFSSPITGKHQNLRDGMVLADPARVFLNAQIPAVSPMLRQMQAKGKATFDLPEVSSPSRSPEPSKHK